MGSLDLPYPQKAPGNVYEPVFLYGTVGVNGSVSSTYDLSSWTQFAIESIPNGTILGTVITLYGAPTVNGPFYPLYGTSGNTQLTVQIGSVTNGIYGPVTPLQPLRFVQLVLPGTQATAQTFTLLAK